LIKVQLFVEATCVGKPLIEWWGSDEE